MRALRLRGWLIVEIGYGMEAEVIRNCEDAGLELETILPDLQSIPRTIVARHR